MKKFFLAVIFTLLGSLLSLGAGIGIAEYRLNNFQPAKKIINLVPQEKEISKEESAVSVAIEPPPASQEEAAQQPQEEKSAEENFSFAVIGDTQQFELGNDLSKAVSFIKTQNVNLVFSVGDLVSSCDSAGECQGKYASWKNKMGTLMGKTYATQGNHDRTGKDKADQVWEKSFNFPLNGPEGFKKFAYSLDFGNSHFVVLDSDKPKENDINGVQRAWLEQDLARNKKTNTFVFFHEPAYPTNSKIGESLDVNAKDRDDLWNILARHKVTAVFSGHEHIFSRRSVNGVYQFGVGNTESFNHLAPKPGMAEYSYVGRHLVIASVSGNKINIKLYSTSGNLINSFDFSK